MTKKISQLLVSVNLCKSVFLFFFSIERKVQPRIPLGVQTELKILLVESIWIHWSLVCFHRLCRSLVKYEYSNCTWVCTRTVSLRELISARFKANVSVDRFQRESYLTRIEHVVYLGLREVFCVDMNANWATRQSCHAFRFSKLATLSGDSMFSMPAYFFSLPLFLNQTKQKYQFPSMKSDWSLFLQCLEHTQLPADEPDPDTLYNKRDNEGFGCRGRKLRESWSNMVGDTVSKNKLFSRSTAFFSSFAQEDNHN